MHPSSSKKHILFEDIEKLREQPSVVEQYRRAIEMSPEELHKKVYNVKPTGKKIENDANSTH